MILVDPNLGPDLDPALAPRSSAAKRPVGADSKSISRADHLPSVRSLTRFLNDARAAVRLRGVVSVLLTTDEALRTLNRDFRRKNKPTDVLSFPAEAGLPEEIAGDLAISVETARHQAVDQSHSLGVEIKILILHGLLHLAGYDHEIDGGKMARRERELRKRLGLPQGLIERSEPARRKKAQAGPLRQAQGRLSTRSPRKLALGDKPRGSKRSGRGKA